MNDDKKKRTVYVPGRTVDVTTIFQDAARYAVLAVSHGDEVVVVFTAPNRPYARAMTREEAAQFTREVRNTHQSIVDDAEIARLEKEFEERDQ